ncbi:MAG: FAD-binding oxidoreductase [Pseudomonadota bacterium]
MSVRSARRTPEDLAGSGWYDILPAADATPALAETIHTDFLVIGAGFAGCHATRRLLELNDTADVVLLEAQDIGFGACGRNSGFMIDLPHELQSDDYSADTSHSEDEIRINRTAIDFATQCAEEFDLGAHLKRVGKYHGAADAAGTRALDAFCDGLDRLNEPYTKLSALDMKALTGSDFYTSGIHTPGCAILQPAGYIRGLVRELDRRYQSLRVFAHSPALRIESRDGEHIVQTPTGKIHAQRLVLTVNGHLASFGWHQRDLMHVFTFATMTRQLSAAAQKTLGGQPEWGLVSAHPMGSTVRRIDNRIIIRNTFTYNPDMATTTEQVERLGERHDRSFARRFGHLGEVPVRSRWGGHLCLSRNSATVFGELEKNLYAACCHNGLGTSKGTLGGMLIADYACGRHSDDLHAMLNGPAPSRLPPAALMTPAARAYLAWTQWRAGKDR